MKWAAWDLLLLFYGQSPSVLVAALSRCSSDPNREEAGGVSVPFPLLPLR